jgi:peptide deformylase
MDDERPQEVGPTAPGAKRRPRGGASPVVTGAALAAGAPAGPPPTIDLARRRRAYEEIRVWGDPVLRAVAHPVTEFDDALAAEVAHQAQVLFDAPGAGLAAPQIGRLRRIVVVRFPEDPEEPFVRALVNPEVVDASAETALFEESCLSMPAVFAAVERAVAVIVRARDATGAPVEIEAEGYRASLLQHELDHLDGVLIPDRLARSERRRYLADLRAALGTGTPTYLAGTSDPG